MSQRSYFIIPFCLQVDISLVATCIHLSGTSMCVCAQKKTDPKCQTYMRPVNDCTEENKMHQVKGKVKDTVSQRIQMYI